MFDVMIELILDFKILKNLGCRYLIPDVKINLLNNKKFIVEKNYIYKF